MKVVILGGTGLLGSAVTEIFTNEAYDVFPSYRKEGVISHKNAFNFCVSSKFSEIVLPKCEYIVNCIGIIKPFMEDDFIESIYANAIFPHKLSKYCKKEGIKLIHITTDCVFSGKDGNYSEESLHDCLDAYGKTKSLGEPSDCMVLRTSIIGEELHKNASLIEWVRKNKGKEINGYTDHIWNGVTTKNYGDICHKIINHNLYEEGLFHIHSDTVSKFKLLNMINEKFNLGIKVNEFRTDPIIRTLSTKKKLNSIVNKKSLQQQIDEM